MRKYNTKAYECFLNNIKSVPCAHCGSAFDRRNPNQRFCSDKCRFINKVKPLPNGCWLWTAATNNKGYGTFKYCGGNDKKAHRVSYEMFVSPIPDGAMVMHICDNPSCVNPDHLRPGRHADNVDDMVRKGRQAVGARHARWNPQSPHHKHNPSSPFYVGPAKT